MSNFVKRVISGVVLSIGYVSSFHFSGYGFFHLYVLILLITVLGIRELFDIFKEGHKVTIVFPAIVFSVFWITYIYGVSLTKYYEYKSEAIPDLLLWSKATASSGFELALSFLILFVILLMSFYVLQPDIKKAFTRISISVISIFYITIPISFVFLLRASDAGVFYMWFVTWATIQADIMAYTFGKLYGRNKIPSQVSPNKTWEGYIGGFIGQMILTFIFYKVVYNFWPVPYFNNIEIILFSGLIFLASVSGDLSESLLKRSAGVKDSGTIIPGHGGVLDRIDSMLFTIPLFYILLAMIHGN